MLTEQDRETAHAAGKTWGEVLKGDQPDPATGKPRTPRPDHGMGIFGGGGSIPMLPRGEGPSKTRIVAGKTGGRIWGATKAATYDRLRAKRRTFLRVLFFGTSTPAGAGWTPAKRSAAARKAIKKRSRAANGRLR